MSEPVFRRAIAGDGRPIAEVHVESWRAAYAGLLPAEFLDGLSVDRRAAFWEEWIVSPDAKATWVAVLDGSVVGFVDAGPARDDDLPGGSGEVRAIYVRSDAWRAGLGRALLERAVEDLEGQRMTPLVLWVLTGNRRGRSFYEHLGWQPDGAARELDVGGTPVEELRYRMPT